MESLLRENTKDMGKKMTYSFEQWCLDNNRQDLLDRWDNELNDAKPSEVSYKSNKKYWIKCPCGKHNSQLQNIQYISAGRQQNLICRECNSFAQYVIDTEGQDVLDYIWSYKNEKSPWEYDKSSNKKVWFICKNNSKHVYHQSLDKYVAGNSCPYCSHRSKIPFIEDSLGFLFPKAVELWSDKNKKDPFQYYPMSYQKVYMKCDKGIHDDYYRRIETGTYTDFKCPACAIQENGENQKLDLTGTHHNMLHPLFIDEERSNKDVTYWFCRCDCGNPELKSISVSHIVSGDIKSCGCLQIKIGEDNPNWQGGKTTESQRARSNSAYKKWRNEVYKKDWFTCQCCGRSRKINKHAHHLINFSNSEELRYSVDNGITMCENCHYPTFEGSFHNIYGTTNNTPEQLEEYINNKRKSLGINIPFSIEGYLNGERLKPDMITN